jgi:hypothetical protein
MATMNKPKEKRPLFHRLSDGTDTVLNLLKWPLAVCSVLMFLPALRVSLDIIMELIRNIGSMLPFICGMAIYGLLWVWLIRGWRVTFFSTLEHEITHAIFAWMTFHRVTGLKSTWKQGGHVTYRGKGNWLITSSPYFVPTICLFMIILFAWTPVVSVPVANALIGAGFAYHATSTYRETHRGQSDLKELGFPWCFLVLPTANLVVNGLVLAYALGGTAGIGSFVGNIWKLFRSMTF